MEKVEPRSSRLLDAAKERNEERITVRKAVISYAGMKEGETHV